DPKTIGDIQQIVRDLRGQGIGILVTDHNVRETLKITDRSYLIKDGVVRCHGTPHEIIHNPIAISEYLGASFDDGPLAGPPPPRPRRRPPPPPTTRPPRRRSTWSSSRRRSTAWSSGSRPTTTRRPRRSCCSAARRWCRR